MDGEREARLRGLRGTKAGSWILVPGYGYVTHELKSNLPRPISQFVSRRARWRIVPVSIVWHASRIGLFTSSTTRTTFLATRNKLRIRKGLTGTKEMDPTDAPFVTVVISTRNRGDKVVAAVQTVLLNDYPGFELSVVDQSEDDRTEVAMRAFSSEPRVRYVKTATEGLSTGRNVGIAGGRGELIAVTDDDCRVPTDWLRELAAAFAVDRRIGVVFGTVLAGPHDRTAGFITSYASRAPVLARSMKDKHRVEGIGACIGLRRTVWEELSGFDQMLGAGAPLKAAEDADLSLRALQAGYFVYETPRVTVTHLGFRSHEESRQLIKGYYYGQGAMLIKHLRGRKWPVIPLLLHMAWRWAFQPSAVNLGTHSHRVMRLASFLRGSVAGATMAIDRTTGHFESNGPEPGKA